MFDPLVQELSQRYGLGDRSRDLFALLMAHIHNEHRGGFGGFIEGFREQGQGELLASWLGNPEATGLSASDVGMVFGQGLLGGWSARLGVSRATLAAAIAGVLPRLVAELTPNGRIPGVVGTWPAMRAFGERADTMWAEDTPQGEASAATPSMDSARLSSTPASEPQAPQLREPDRRYRYRTPPAMDDARASADADVSAQPASARGAEDDVAAPITVAEIPRPLRDDALGALVPGDERRPISETPASEPLRHEPIFADQRRRPPRMETPSAGLRREPGPPSPASATPRDNNIRENTRDDDPAASMAAAFDHDPHRHPAHGQGVPPYPGEWRRPPPPPPSQLWSTLFWILVGVALLAAIGWYAWNQGLLDPYLRQFGLPARQPPPQLPPAL